MPTHDLEGLLLACLHKDPGGVRPADLRALSGDAWSEWVRMAIRAGVGPLLYQRLQDHGLADAVPAQVMRRLERRYERNAVRVLRILAELNKLARRVQDARIPLIVLKGVHLAVAAYDNIALREMNDLDLLVRRRDLAKVAQALTELGYVSAGPFTIEPDLRWEWKWGLHHLPRFMKEGAPGIDVHWSITPPEEPYSIASDELWERAVPLHLAGVDLLGLAAEDLILHLAMHTSYQHDFVMGLRPSCDLAALLRRHGEAIRWEDVGERAGRWGWQRGVYLALRLAQELLGAAVPDAVLADLQPPDFAPGVLAAAKGQVFAKSEVAAEMPSGLTQLTASSGRREKAATLLRSVFPTRAFLAKVYGVPVASPRLYLYYPVRLKDVLMTRSSAAWQLLRRDPERVQAARRKQLLRTWLAQ